MEFRGGQYISEDSFNKLKDSISWSIQQLEQPRKNRIEALNQYVTSHYGLDSDKKRVPTNFLELAITIYSRQLSPRNPRCTVDVKNKQLKPMANMFELALNQIPEEVNLVDSVRLAVMEGLFSMGVVKIGLHASGKNLYEGTDVGEPFVDVIDFGDYFLDMSAKSYDGIQYEGNDYWMVLEDVKSFYNVGGDDSEIQADEWVNCNPETGEEESNSLTADGGGVEIFNDRVLLRDVWLPREQLMVTYAVTSGKLLRVVPFDGPEEGPYHRLGFSDVVGNLLPLPPVSLWYDLHDLGNSLFRKLARGADSFKRVAAFAGGNEEDILRFRDASDGDAVRFQGANAQAIASGGVDQPTLAFFLQIRDLYSYFAGNLDSLGGLSPQADTATQDQLLNEAANARMQFMSERTVEFLNGIFNTLAWYEWTDPVRQRSLVYRLEGVDGEFILDWTPETREGDFLDYNIKINVFSLQDDSPNAKLRRIGVIFQQYIVPLIPMIQQQGGTIDVAELIRQLARLSGTPEIEDIVKFPGQDNSMMQQPILGNPQPMATPPQTKRTYERISRSTGGTRASRDMVMSQALLGKNVQDSQKKQLG